MKVVWKRISQSGCGRLEKLEEMQWSTVRQNDVSETEGEGLQNSDHASNSIWDTTWATTKKQEYGLR